MGEHPFQASAPAGAPPGLDACRVDRRDRADSDRSRCNGRTAGCRPKHAFTAAVANRRKGEGFRTPAPYGTVVQGEGFRTPAPYRTVVRLLGPAFESLPRRKPRGGWGLVRRARPMEILGWRTNRSRDFGRWRRGEFAAGVKTTRFFAQGSARGGCRRGGWRGTGERVRTSASCSGARLEAGRNGVARRMAGRRRS